MAGQHRAGHHITQGDELRVRFSYSVDEGALPRTKITTYYRFDGTGNWNNKTETYRRVPGLYEMNIAANEAVRPRSMSSST